jgi:hypothetical protein
MALQFPLMFIVPHRRLHCPLYPHRHRHSKSTEASCFASLSLRRVDALSRSGGASFLASPVEDGFVDARAWTAGPCCPYPHRYASPPRIRSASFSSPGRVDALSRSGGSSFPCRGGWLRGGRWDMAHSSLPSDVYVARPPSSTSKSTEDPCFASFFGAGTRRRTFQERRY